MFTKINSQVGL